MIERSLNTLPTELLVTIYKLLPIEDRMITMPKVSKIWRFIYAESNDLENFAKEVLKERIKNFDYSKDEIKKILMFAKNNNYISEIKNKKLAIEKKSSLSSTSFKVKSKQNKIEKSISLLNQDQLSNFFFVSVLRKAGNKKYFSNSFSLQLQYSISFDCNNTGFSNALIAGSESFKEKKDLNDSKKFSQINVAQGMEINRLVEDALTLQIKLHSEYFAFLNVTTLSHMNINKFDDITNKLVLNCNENGLIKNHNEKDQNKKYFIIHKKKFDKISILTWNAPANMDIGKDITEFFRQTVFSSTIRMLNEKMGTKLIKT